MDKQQSKPPVKKVRGSYFPNIERKTLYEVSTVSGDVIYAGSSHHVARIIKACMTPRG